MEDFEARASAQVLGGHREPRRGGSTTFIVFDWDDTLFPTSPLLEDRVLDARGEGTTFNELMTLDATEFVRLIDAESRGLLELADRLGDVCIVTLAAESWFRTTSTSFMPLTSAALSTLRLPVHFARTCCTMRDCWRSESDDSADLPTLCKKRAITRHLRAQRAPKEIQLVCIGDACYEMDASIDVAWQWSADSICKLVHVAAPSPASSGFKAHLAQLRIVRNCLSSVCGHDGSLDISTGVVSDAISWWRPGHDTDGGEIRPVATSFHCCADAGLAGAEVDSEELCPAGQVRATWPRRREPQMRCGEDMVVAPPEKTSADSLAF